MPRESIRHLDEARAAIIEALKERWEVFGADKVLIIEDAFGCITFGVWGEAPSSEAFAELLASVSPFGAETWFRARGNMGDFDPMELQQSWEEAASLDPGGDWDERLRLIVRHRMLPAWQHSTERSLLRQLGAHDCPVLAFYSFKGGMGRSTALALFALDRMSRDEHVVVIDLDIDAPGLGSILPSGASSLYGVVDYLLELPVAGSRPEDLRDFYYNLDLPGIRSTGSIKVFPAGRLDEFYLGKMARLDFEPVESTGGELRHPLEELVAQVYQELHPDWILIDSRTGFSETAGMILSGLCDYHVLFGVQSDQSWEGLGYAIKRLGLDRLQRGYHQAEFMLVQSMVPETPKEKRDSSMAAFAGKAGDVCAGSYYLEPEPARDDAFWYLDDAGGESAPDSPITMLYKAALSQAVSLPELLDTLRSSKDIQDFCAVLNERVGALGLELPK